ncbi:12-oxophytodienoate reductase [bacterium]|nr:12-oxophytodienoate reductase [bacterium]
MSRTDALFRPFRLAGMELKNRIVMAPMTRSRSPGGFPQDHNVAYYARRAAAEVGLILSEGTTTRRPAASNDPNVPNFHTKEALAGWGRVIEAVHAAGGKMGPQIWHQGMARKPGSGPHPDAPSDGPSGVTLTGKQVQDPPSDEEVQDMANAYGEAAGAAADLGFDCVELHGAHGYLIDEFLWERTNLRTDRWGGGIEKRAEFAAECIRLSKKAVGGRIPILIRISQWKSSDYNARLAETPQEMEQLVRVLISAGVDLIHCSQRRFWEPEFPEIDGPNGLNFAGWVKKLTGVATCTVGSVGLAGEFTAAFRGEGATKDDLDQLMERMEREEFDLVAVGRALLQDPAWAAKVKAGRFDDLADYDAGALAAYH